MRRPPGAHVYTLLYGLHRSKSIRLTVEIFDVVIIATSFRLVAIGRRNKKTDQSLSEMLWSVPVSSCCLSLLYYRLTIDYRPGIPYAGPSPGAERIGIMIALSILDW
jgi:hypothetical protein